MEFNKLKLLLVQEEATYETQIWMIENLNLEPEGKFLKLLKAHSVVLEAIKKEVEELESQSEFGTIHPVSNNYYPSPQSWSPLNTSQHSINDDSNCEMEDITCNTPDSHNNDNSNTGSCDNISTIKELHGSLLVTKDSVGANTLLTSNSSSSHILAASSSSSSIVLDKSCSSTTTTATTGG